MWSPLRARKKDKLGLLKPFVPFETFGNPKTLNCDRDSQGDELYADMSVSIVRTKCLDNLTFKTNKGNDRRISKTSIRNIVQYLLYQKSNIIKIDTNNI